MLVDLEAVAVAALTQYLVRTPTTSPGRSQRERTTTAEEERECIYVGGRGRGGEEKGRGKGEEELIEQMVWKCRK